MDCRMQEKELELESVRSQARLWLECASVQHNRDKQVDGNVSISKCLAGLGMVYSYESMFYGRGICDRQDIVYTNSEFIFSHIKAFLKDEDERD